MSTRQEEIYRLLQDQTECGSKESLSDCQSLKSHQDPDASLVDRLKAQTKGRSTAIPLLILSGVINVLLVALLISYSLDSSLLTQKENRADSVNSSPYGQTVYLQKGAIANSPPAGLTLSESVEFPYSTGYGPEVTNHSLLDDRWEAIDINSGVVAITDEWASEHNLAPTQRFPWDTSKGVYLITAFHTLHCLKNIHRLLYDAHHGRPLSRDIGHAMHCVDHMRKDAMCEANDFLLPSPKSRYGDPGPQGQSRVCKDWNTLVNWAHKRNACYQHISDDEEGFAEEHEEIERYMNCPPSSPYLQTMQEFANSTDRGM